MPAGGFAQRKAAARAHCRRMFAGGGVKNFRPARCGAATLTPAPHTAEAALRRGGGEVSNWKYEE